MTIPRNQETIRQVMTNGATPRKKAPVAAAFALLALLGCLLAAVWLHSWEWAATGLITFAIVCMIAALVDILRGRR